METKKKGGILKWVIIVLVVLFIIGVLASVGDDNTDKPSDSNPKKVEESKNDTSEKQQKNNESASKSDSSEKKDDSEKGKEEGNKFKVGEVVETSDLKIHFAGAEKYVSDNEFIQPDKGNVFYKMDFEFENISDSDKMVSSYDFKCYADGYDMEQSYMDGLDLDATLSKGKKTKGSVFFQVPKDAKEITLEYETNMWSEDKVVFVVK